LKLVCFLRRADYSQGIFQSIGFKEFHEFLVLPPAERGTERGAKLLEGGVAALKLVTRRYARKQLRWLNNRVLRQGREVTMVLDF
jgi:tRNA dimethylallyltransferase